MKNTPAVQAKALGLTGINEVSKLSGVAVTTLWDWSKTKPLLFKTVLHGCVAIKAENHDQQKQ